MRNLSQPQRRLLVELLEAGAASIGYGQRLRCAEALCTKGLVVIERDFLWWRGGTVELTADGRRIARNALNSPGLRNRAIEAAVRRRIQKSWASGV